MSDGAEHRGQADGREQSGTELLMSTGRAGSPCRAGSRWRPASGRARPTIFAISTEDRAIGMDRKRSMTPLLEVLVEAGADRHGDVHAHHRHQAGDHVVDVRPAGRPCRADRAAEDVHEQQREDDRHQQRVEHRLRVLLDLQQVAAHQRADVPQIGPQADPALAVDAPGRGGRGRRASGGQRSRALMRRPPRGVVSVTARVFSPVMARNTSSRLGSCGADGAMREAARAEQADHGGQLLVAEDRYVQHALVRDGLGAGDAVEPGLAERRGPCAAQLRRIGGPDLQGAAADLRLQLVDARRWR